MGKIVAIGGEDIRKKGTTSIDKEIVRLSGKRHPRLLFIPTASSDHRGYWDTVREHFRRLGCRPDVLFLIREKLSYQGIKGKILRSDIIYVGGGNTLMMMKLWRKRGVGRLLKEAYKKNTVLCGLSAGSICWFESGHSDSMAFYHPKSWRYINVKGLGLVRGIYCPHFDGQTLGVKRRNAFRKMIKKIGGFGVAVDNHCAIEFVGGRYRIVASRSNANAYRVFKEKRRVLVKRITKQEKFSDLDSLYLSK